LQNYQIKSRHISGLLFARSLFNLTGSKNNTFAFNSEVQNSF